MPRISQVALATLELVDPESDGLEVVRRIRTPDELTTEQKAAFEHVVNTMPAEWFVPANSAALAQYARHVVAARRIGEGIESAILAGRDGDVERLLKMQIAESRIIYQLMLGLRLTPASVAPINQSAKKLRSPESPWSAFGQRQQSEPKQIESD